MKKLILLLLFIPLVSFGQDNMYYVSSEGGLNVRDKPGSEGKKIATLLVDDLVYLLEKTDISLTLNDLNKSTGEKKEISGQWVKIKTHTPPKLKGDKILWKNNDQNIEGYVFDGFIKKIIVNNESEIILKYSNYRLERGELESSIISENQEAYNIYMMLIDPCSENNNKVYAGYQRSSNEIKPCILPLFGDDWKKVYKNLYRNKFLVISYFKSAHYQNKLIIKKVELLDDLLKSKSDDSNISKEHITFNRNGRHQIDLGWDIKKNTTQKEFNIDDELIDKNLEAFISLERDVNIFNERRDSEEAYNYFFEEEYPISSFFYGYRNIVLSNVNRFLKLLKQITGKDVFISGPHEESFQSQSKEFGYYNTLFIDELIDKIKSLSPTKKNIIRPFYNSLLKLPIRRLMNYHILDLLTPGYKKEIYGDTYMISDGISEMLDYNSLVKKIKKKEWSNTSLNETLFWIRRNYDHTADKFFELFKLIIDEFDEDVLPIEGMKKLFYYSSKGDNWIHKGGNEFRQKDDNTMILYDEFSYQNNYDASSREVSESFETLIDIDKLYSLKLYAYTRKGRFPLEIIDAKINSLPIYCDFENSSKQIEISYKKIEPEILFISSTDLTIENSFINASPLKDKSWANDNDSLLFPSNSENKNVTLYKFGENNNAFIASVSGTINSVRNCEPEWDDPYAYNCEIFYPIKSTFNAYYYVENEKIILLSQSFDEIKGFQDINNDGVLDIIFGETIYFSNENGFLIYDLITNKVWEEERC